MIQFFLIIRRVQNLLCMLVVIFYSYFVTLFFLNFFLSFFDLIGSGQYYIALMA